MASSPAATLRDGTVVLGKMYKDEICACTYANRSQAQTAAAKHGGQVIHRGRPFYVKLSVVRPEVAS